MDLQGVSKAGRPFWRLLLGPNETKGKNHGTSKRQMANKYMKRLSPSLIIREMLVKTTVRYRLTPVRTAFIEKTKDKC